MFFYSSECASKGLSECILPPHSNKKNTENININHHFPVTKLLSTSTYLVDVIHHGWAKSSRILVYCTTFAQKLLHKTHLKTENHAVRKSLALQCPVFSSPWLAREPRCSSLEVCRSSICYLCTKFSKLLRELQPKDKPRQYFSE